MTDDIKKSAWKGFTLNEMRRERAVALALIEVEKERASIDYERARHGNFGLPGSIFTRLLGALSYADYLVLGVQLFRRLSPIFSKKDKK